MEDDQHYATKLRIERAFGELFYHQEQQSKVEDESEPAPGECRPWSLKDFRRRVQTFRVPTWFSKPASIDPLRCARRGWINSGLNELECENCKSRLTFETPTSLDADHVREVVSAFRKELNNAHKGLCPWRDNASPIAFLAFPVELTGPELATEAFAKRFRSLTKLDSVPEISDSFIANLARRDRQKAVAEVLLRVALNYDGPITARHTSACLLALCGWEAEGAHAADAHLHCSLCGRRAGPWNFRPAVFVPPAAPAAATNEEATVPSDDAACDEVPDVDSSRKRKAQEPVEGERETKRRKDVGGCTPAASAGAGEDVATPDDTKEDGVAFDPISQHRWFCAWVRPGTTVEEGDGGATTSPPGWQQTLSALLPSFTLPAESSASSPEKVFAGVMQVIQRTASTT